MSQQEMQAKFEDELNAYTEVTPFPPEGIPEQFNDWKREAMRFYSPSTLKQTPAEFETLYNKAKGYSVNDLGRLLSIMEPATMKNLDMDFVDYMFYQNTLETLAATWKDIVYPKQTELQRKYQAMARLAQPGSGRAIPMPKPKAQA